jgi:hypothetical protein
MPTEADTCRKLVFPILQQEPGIAEIVQGIQKPLMKHRA